MRYFNIRKYTFEDKFDRHYACYWKRGARSVKRANRRQFRRILKRLTMEEIRDVDNCCGIKENL